MSAEVAIAVVSWNTREPLRGCLESMRADSDSGLAEVWVLDNGSGDGSQEMVEREFPWVRLVRSEENLGYGAGVNEIAQRTSTPWIAAANSDIELEPGALRRMLEAGEEEPEVGSVAPRLIMPSGEWQHSIYRFPSPSLALAFNLGVIHLPGAGDRLLMDGKTDPDLTRRVDWAHGALLVMRRPAFEQIGGFDREQWMYAEDVDIAWRLARAGWATLYVADARVKHLVSAAATQAFGDTRVVRHTVATADWMRRRRGRVRTLAYALINLTGAAIRTAALAPLAMVAPRRWGAARERMRSFVSAHAQAVRTALR